MHTLTLPPLPLFSSSVPLLFFPRSSLRRYAAHLRDSSLEVTYTIFLDEMMKYSLVEQHKCYALACKFLSADAHTLCRNFAAKVGGTTHIHVHAHALVHVHTRDLTHTQTHTCTFSR